MFRMLTFTLILFACRLGRTEEADFFLVWGPEGKWDGSLDVAGGRLVDVQPFSFDAQYGDKLLSVDEHRAAWRSGTAGQVDGIHVRAQLTPQSVLRFKTLSGTRNLTWSDFPPDVNRDREIRFPGRNRLLVIGRGDPARGPRLGTGMALPKLFVPPRPANVVALGDSPQPDKIDVQFTEPALGPLAVRRASMNNGRLYLELYCPAGPLRGRAEIQSGDRRIVVDSVAGSLWLSRLSRIGTMAITVHQPTADGGDQTIHLVAPTTLIETRGPSLYLNGEPLLVKGTLPRDLNDTDAAWLKSLGANTIRTSELEYLDKYDFLGVVPVRPWSARFCERAKSDQEFFETLDRQLAANVEKYRTAPSDPRILVLQLGNEQVMGQDAWGGRSGRRAFDRLDFLLASCYNAFKPMDLMVPLGYSNCAFGYRAPDFLDVYLHNTYLDKDRGWPPVEQFMKFQGCDRRPFIHTEYGANVYMPQVYLRGPNTPVMEKLHAWNYPHRWNSYLAAGTIGAINYCFYDYDYSKVNPESWDKGFTNFGVMTFDRKPKLACWELWHLWRDFEVQPASRGLVHFSAENRISREDAGRKDGPVPFDAEGLVIRYRRDYWARNCRLTLESAAGREVIRLDDFPPQSQRTIHPAHSAESFRWRIDYTTHGGLTMIAQGAYPAEVEADDFLARLKDRPTYPFLRELFDAEVLTADGRRVATAIKDMERADGVVTVALRKPNGVVYVTALARRSKTPYFGPVDLDLAFSGHVQAVDEMTGQPNGAAVDVESTSSGIRLKNVRVPWVPDRYGQRQPTPVSMPVFRIDPQP